MNQKANYSVRIKRTLALTAGLAMASCFGCIDEHEARVRRAIEEHEKTHRAVEAAAPSDVTAGKSGYPINEHLQLEIGMNRSDVERLLPRSPDDPPDAASGMYGVAIRSLGDGAVSLTFRDAKLSTLAISRRYSPTEASKYRAWLEKQYGVPKIDGNRMSWTEDPSRSVMALFQSDGSGYRVQTTLYNAAAERDMKSGEEPGTRPFEIPEIPGSENLTIGK